MTDCCISVLGNRRQRIEVLVAVLEHGQFIHCRKDEVLIFKLSH